MSDTSKPPPHGVEVRSAGPDDAPGLARFDNGITEGERRFLREDLAGAPLAEVAPDGVRRLVAVTDGRGIVGFAAAYAGAGWSSHVAELRVLVGAADRGHGIGRSLARAVVAQALRLGCTTLFVEVVAEQEALVTMFEELGFGPVALLPDFVRDAEGELRDLVVLALHVHDHGLLSAVGLQDVEA